MLIRAGSILIVPRSAKQEADVTDEIADNGQLNLQPERITRRMTIKAGKKDTVASIARRYKVSAKEVAEWNSTNATAAFAHGQQVVVYVPVRTTVHHASHGKSSKAIARSKSSVVKQVSARKSTKASKTAKN
jgi:membrane-bound lytic murein transglycosylase D